MGIGAVPPKADPLGLRILDPDSTLGEVASSREGDGCLLS
jgi:hypothetical protein